MGKRHKRRQNASRETLAADGERSETRKNTPPKRNLPLLLLGVTLLIVWLAILVWLALDTRRGNHVQSPSSPTDVPATLAALSQEGPS